MNTFVEDFKTNVTAAFTDYAKFEGRASRPQYWYFYLFVLLGNVIFDPISHTLHGLFVLATIVPLLAVGARRLHDVNRSGWWQLIALTIIGLIPLIYWLAQPANNDTTAP